MSLELLIIASFATYRLTYMLNSEAGAWDMFGRFRTWAGVKYDEHSRPYATGQLSEAVMCFYCLSVWIGIGITGFIVIMQIIGYPVIAIHALLPFAISGVATFFKRWAG